MPNANSEGTIRTIQGCSGATRLRLLAMFGGDESRVRHVCRISLRQEAMKVVVRNGFLVSAEGIV